MYLLNLQVSAAGTSQMFSVTSWDFTPVTFLTPSNTLLQRVSRLHLVKPEDLLNASTQKNVRLK